MTVSAIKSARGAFVLPMVIALMIVVALTAAVMLNRGVAASRTVSRQIDSYRVQHSVRGLQEAVEAWLSQQRARTLPDVLDDDGYALTLLPGNGTRVAMYFFDGQGTARANALGVAEDIADDVAAVADQLLRAHGQDGSRRYLREVGPFTVSINGAEPEVLFAMAEVLAPEDKVSDLRDELARFIELRESEPLGQEAITQLMNRVRISGAERTRILRMWTPQPTLWEVVIVVKGDGIASTGEIARYRCLVLLDAGASEGAFEQPSPFLQWDELERGDTRFEDPRYWEVGR